MDELTEKYQEWCDRDHTHLIRQLNLIRRHVLNEKAWLDVLDEKNLDFSERKAKLIKLRQELGNIYDETREFMDDLMEDKKRFVEILTLLGKEFEKLPNE